jgi:hypothetical protein
MPGFSNENAYLGPNSTSLLPFILSNKRAFSADLCVENSVRDNVLYCIAPLQPARQLQKDIKTRITLISATGCERDGFFDEQS